MGRVLLKLNKLLSCSRSIACKSQQQWKHLREYDQLAELMNKNGRYASKGFVVSSFGEVRKTIWDISASGKDFHGAAKPSSVNNSTFYSTSMAGFRLPFQAIENSGTSTRITSFSRSMSSSASEQRGKNTSETRKDVSTVEDPFDAPTYNIPEKPVTFTEGASYSVIILAGLGIAAAAGYAVFKELIFQPKEYMIFNKSLKRVQDDSQVRVRIGSPITGYGQESRNRAARQRIPHRVRTDEDGIEHVEVNFYIRGPHGAGKVYAAMFKDQVDKEWKFTSLIVDILSPSPAQLILESYLPA